MAEIEEVVYSNWQKGSAFSKRLIAGMGEIDDFQSMNLQLYKSGQLGPRPWFARTYPTHSYAGGLSPDAINYGGFYMEPTIGSQLLLVDSDLYYKYQYVAAWSSYATVLAALPDAQYPRSGEEGQYLNRYQFVPVSTTQVFVTPMFMWNPATLAAPSAVTWPGGVTVRGVAVWKERAFGWGDTSAANRIYYSDAGALTTFTSASQYFDVGSAKIVGVFALRDALLISCDDNRWFVLSGGSPTTWTLREIGRFPRVSGWAYCAIYNNAVWFFSREHRSILAMTPEGPVREFLYVTPNVDIPEQQPTISMLFPVAAYETEMLLFPYVGDTNLTVGTDAAPYLGFQSLEMQDGAWFWHKYWVTASGTNGYGHYNSGARILGAWDYAGYLFIMVDESDLTNKSTDHISIYTRPYTLNRPSNSDDSFSAKYEELTGIVSNTTSSTNQTACELVFRQYAPPPGYEVRVKEVILDCSYWDGSTYLDPAISLGVRTSTGTWDTYTLSQSDHNLTNTSTGDSGAFGRAVWQPANQPFLDYAQVGFFAAVGVAFSKVIVKYEIRRGTT